MKKTIIATLIICLSFTGSAFANLSVKERINVANDIVQKTNLQGEFIETKDFTLLTFSKITEPKSYLNVYIESDGFAWKNRNTISENPTPQNPISLRLAVVDKDPNVLYIARPCQYVNLKKETNCDNKFWTRSRFAPEIIASINEVINQFKAKYDFKIINLFGYSGGGAVAILAASQRNDVYFIKTAAGSLNHKKLTEIHEVTPLAGSLDAIDVAKKVIKIKQLHLIGGNDDIVTKDVIISFVDKARSLGGKRIKYRIIDGITHRDDKWPEIWEKENY